MRDRAAFLRPIAHRGLHDVSQGIIENSLQAFAAAIAGGYGIECDLRPAAGGLPVVFHDETLDRLLDAEGPIAELSADDLTPLRYRNSDTTGVPTFAAFLDFVAGRAPLLVEIKSEWGPPDGNFLSAIARFASAYRGPVALMSFDPAVMVEIKALAPEVPRGVVSGSYYNPDGTGWYPGKMDDARRKSLATLSECDLVAPDFIAYHVKALPCAAASHARDVLGLPLFTWTVRTEDDRSLAAQYADAPVFEGYRA